MKSRKVFLVFSLLFIVSLAFIGCPMSDPNMELEIPPNPPIAGAPSGRAVVQRPGYEKYWPVGGYVEVDMTVYQGVITRVVIFLSHDDPVLARVINEYWGHNDMIGPGWMVERNSVDLDIVAGATATSIAVLDAAAEALEHIINGTQPQPSIFLDRELVFMSAGTSQTLNARVMLLDAFDLIWTSSDVNIATVSDGIIMAGDRNGLATITVTDPEERASAASLVVVHGAGPDSGIMEVVRRVAMGGHFDPLTERPIGMGAENIWLVDDSGFLAMGKDVLNSTQRGDPISSWQIMRRIEDGSEPVRFGIRNLHTRNYINIYGIDLGTNNDSFAASQPLVSPFRDHPSFFWTLLPVEGGYNIVSYCGTGALSNKDFPSEYWDFNVNLDPILPEPTYAVSSTRNTFLSEPCMEPFYFKLVQWRSDREANSTNPAFVFDIIDE